MVVFVIAMVCSSYILAKSDLNETSKQLKHKTERLKIIHISDLTGDELNGIMSGQHPDTVIEFSANTSLPISFYLKGELFSTEGEEDTVTLLNIKRSFYVRYLAGDLYMSTNLHDWCSFYDFISGSITAAITVNDDVSSIVFGAEVNSSL